MVGGETLWITLTKGILGHVVSVKIKEKQWPTTLYALHLKYFCINYCKDQMDLIRPAASEIHLKTPKVKKPLKKYPILFSSSQMICSVVRMRMRVVYCLSVAFTSCGIHNTVNKPLLLGWGKGVVLRKKYQLGKLKN